MECDVLSIPNKHLSISGTLTTTNIIMANWSRDMWQGVVNRVVRALVSANFLRRSRVEYEKILFSNCLPHGNGTA
ncbi:hypothetical protein KIN20_014237 [Parelaphostrongylus tenuis]|uniref:Uncharacterized protein n=1 Tax=Parelaphostrongylus tenuis TaxID=148309 RepID=A0AAD5MDB6_PARTN|nr:hypothetical protein KIN20_014237 [Parelaphostrongylus tenuis]